MTARNKLFFVKEDCQFALGALVRIASVHQVAANRRRKVGADRSGRSIQRIRRTHELTASRDRVLAFDSHCDERTAGDEIHQALEERLAFVFAVMFARALAVELHELHRNDDVAAAFDARDDFAGKAAGNSVRFAQNKGSLNCHNGRWLRAAGKRGLHRETAHMHRFSRLVRVAETGSTNDDVARILGEPDARGLVLTAGFQHNGAGRRGRSWVAPAGSALLCTIAPPDPVASADLWMVPFWAALVTKDALNALGAACMLQWPNDVLIGAKKVAGILCISRVNGESAWVGCGIGINVVRPQNESVFEGLESPPAFVDDVANATVDGMLDALIASAESAYPLLQDPAGVASAWQHAAGLPRAYRVLRDNEAAPFECTALRLSSDGSLVVARGGREELVTLADARALR